MLRKTTKDFEFLLVKRADRPDDVWSGQMALPGGKRESKDANLKTTVIREVQEETGINLATDNFIGVLDTVQSFPKSNLSILPFVVFLQHQPEVKLNHAELETYIWVPLEKLTLNEAETTQNGFGKVPCFKIENAIVWGITYRILSNFTKILKRTQKSEA